ncbi:hypothetical protein WAI453_006261 [Rhynchosporium graminicola]|uniref:Thiol methyltransferase n=1 Tax=Rhynchosporium graminicola TaxID=2792576 RepID=A0A1E1L746_9HELO|nr:uncharacterized protein RCO7_03326 [Rhynchosporium commune]
MEAPLSSPRLPQQNQNHNSYFNSSSKPCTQSGPTSAPQTQSQAQNQQQIPQPPPAQQQARSADATSPFLRDFNLVAEAAKRAQMACLMRDLEGVAI